MSHRVSMSVSQVTVVLKNRYSCSHSVQIWPVGVRQSCAAKTMANYTDRCTPIKNSRICPVTLFYSCQLPPNMNVDQCGVCFSTALLTFFLPRILYLADPVSFRDNSRALTV